MTTRWLFGDQLGPHFADDHRGRGGKRLLVEDFYRRARLAHGVLVEQEDARGNRAP